MYLKSIDVVGYKSFAIKTHLDFAPGITGIVGPNGCGKSNIMESVRWCLGEMSYKSLRADAMIEVIFSGTEKRPPLSMTEVTLTFDNSSTQLPTQYSEVTVTRRIYRSGESAYFLNRTQCRLKDIREMFLDTGVGGEGYAIIDQGGVEFILRAKPEERRALFEEAAGVSKYKAKREEALRKLERVEADMARLQDSLSLIDEQVRNLDAAARKAKLFKKYEEELAGLEAAKSLADLAALEAGLAELAGKAGPAQERLEAKRSAVTAEEAEVARLELEKAARQGELVAIGGRIAELKGEIGRLDERCSAADETVSAVDKRRAACETDLASARTRLGEMGPQISQVGADVDRVRAALDAAQTEFDGWQAQVDAGAAALAEAEKESEARRSETMSAADAAVAAGRDVSLRESDLGHHISRVGGVLRNLQQNCDAELRHRAEAEAARLESEGQAARVAEARERAAAAQSALAALRQGQKELSEEILRLHAEVSGTKARAESLEAQGGQNPYWTGAQAVLNAGIEGVVGSVRSLIKVEEAWRPFVEDLLGERLFAVVCENSSAARTGIELLQASGSGRARFLVLSTLGGGSGDRAYPEQAQPLLRHVQYDPRHEAAVRFLFAESYALDKALFGDHWVCGGAQPGPGAQPTLADLEDLRSQLAALEAGAARSGAEAVRLEAEASAAERAMHEAVSSVGAETSRDEALRKRLQDRQEAWELALKNVQVDTDFAVGILRDISLTKEELIGLRVRRGEAEEREKACRQVEAQAMERTQSAKDALVEKRSGQQVLKERVEGYEREMSSHAGRYEQLVEGKKHAEASVSARTQELEDLARRRAESVAAKDQSRQQTQVLRSELGGHENAAAAANERLQEADKSLQSRSHGLHGLKAELESAQQELHGLDVQKGQLQTRQEMLRAALWDQRQLTVEEARAKFGEIVVDLEKIETLRKRISGMGPINLGAPEEYEALAQRQSFLTAQLSDLTQAKDDLKAAIQKINATTRENFRQTFSDAREHFRRLYGVLFEGGEADLVLTNPDDILETGVEIVAQPPGKRLQSISLLSGGEKTMTAIALLFAFFMVRPSPFCMLDEADAALDDANIERFTNMIKEFGSHTQFLIISHNKRTMEAADTIYGVTMEEKGVSQIVSIEFEKRARTHAPARPSEPKAEPAPAPAAAPVEVAAVQPTLPMEASSAPASEPQPVAESAPIEPPAADEQTPQG